MGTMEIEYCDWCYESETDVVEPTHYGLKWGTKKLDLCDECFKEYQEEMKEENDC